MCSNSPSRQKVDGACFGRQHRARYHPHPTSILALTLKLQQSYRDRAIAISPGSDHGYAPGTFVICAIGGGAEGWSISHVGPDGRAQDLGGEYHFATVEEAIEFTHELIDLQSSSAE